MDENFKEIHKWESIKDAADSIKVGYKAIWSASKRFTKKGLPQKSGGFYWKHEKEII